MVSSRRGRSPHGRSIPLRHGTRGKCTTAPVIGSVCDVVTLKSVRLSSPVARVPVDVTVPATVAGDGRAGIIASGAGAGASAGTSVSSPCPCECECPVDDGGGDADGKPEPGNTAESGGEPTSPTSPPWRRPGRWSSKEIELECTSDPPLLPVCPREWLRAEREDAPAEPEGLRDEYGLRCERVECNEPISERRTSRGWTTVGWKGSVRLASRLRR